MRPDTYARADCCLVIKEATRVATTRLFLLCGTKQEKALEESRAALFVKCCDFLSIVIAILLIYNNIRMMSSLFLFIFLIGGAGNSERGAYHFSLSVRTPPLLGHLMPRKRRALVFDIILNFSRPIAERNPMLNSRSDSSWTVI